MASTQALTGLSSCSETFHCVCVQTPNSSVTVLYPQLGSSYENSGTESYLAPENLAAELGMQQTMGSPRALLSQRLYCSVILLLSMKALLLRRHPPDGLVSVAAGKDTAHVTALSKLTRKVPSTLGVSEGLLQPFIAGQSLLSDTSH